MLSRRFILSLSATLTLFAAACGGDSGPVSPGPLPGPAATILSGTVTLLGEGGPAHPSGVRMELYASMAAYESRKPTVVTPLLHTGGLSRVYRFEFPNLTPGDYFGVACFNFGCGDYRKPGTGELLRITVAPARTTYLHFGV